MLYIIIKYAEESRRCCTTHSNSVEKEVVHSSKFYIFSSQNKCFQSTTTNRRSRQSDLLFLAFHKEKPSPSGATVSLLLQQGFIFHDWHFYMPNMSYFACCSVPYFQKEVKEDTVKVCQSKCHCWIPILMTQPFFSMKGRAKQRKLGLPRFQFPVLEYREWYLSKQFNLGRFVDR